MTPPTLQQLPHGVQDALTIADLGWSVFRVSLDLQFDGTYKKVPHNWPGATRDPDKIRNTWSGPNADSYIGFAMGDGTVGIDVDTKHNKEGQKWWEAEGYDLLLPYTYPTLSNGWHCLALTDAKIKCPTLWGKLGVDIKGEGGWLFAHAIPPRKSELRRLPEALETALSVPEKPERPATKALGPERVFATEIPFGTQVIINRELARLDVCKAVGWGTDWDVTAFAVAAQLIEISNTPELGYSREQAYSDFIERAPVDNAGFGPAKVEEKWRSAEQRVGDQERPDLIPASPEDVFDAWVKAEPTNVEANRSAAAGAVDPLRRMADEQKLRIRARKLAERELRDEESPQLDLPRLVGLDTFLAEPDEDQEYRIEGLWPTGGRIVLAAQFKAGKTTFVSNTVRCLADGDPLLGRFNVKQADRILLLDNEMSPGQLRRWLRDQGANNPERAGLVSLRGSLSTFNIMDDKVRDRWADHLGPADVVIFDCLRPALDSLGLSEDKDAGQFLVALDELVRVAGIGELLVVHHMGHSNERSRGDSRIIDWPDATWKLLREDEFSPRYFSARGRDVEETEKELGHDPATRHLTIIGGSRKQAKDDSAFADLVIAACLAVEINPGMNTTAIAKAMRDDGAKMQRGAESKALAAAVAAGKLMQKPGKGLEKLYFPAVKS